MLATEAAVEAPAERGGARVARVCATRCCRAKESGGDVEVEVAGHAALGGGGTAQVGMSAIR